VNWWEIGRICAWQERGIGAAEVRATLSIIVLLVRLS
jgi:hypothetical protein